MTQSKGQMLLAEETVSDLIMTIYSASASPVSWNAVLRKCAEAFSSFGAQINILNPANGQVDLAMTYGCEWLTPERLRRFQELAPSDPRAPYGIAHLGMPFGCRQTCDEAVLFESRMYKEILGPGDCEYIAAAGIPYGDRLAFLSVLRHRSQGAYTQSEVGQLGLLIPHFRRSLRIGQTLSQMDYSREVAAAAFDALSVGVVLLSTDGVLLFASSVADKLLRRGGRALEVDKPLATGSDALVARLRSAIDAVARAEPGDNAVRPASIRLDGDGARAIQVTIVGIDDERARPLLGKVDRPCVLGIVEDPSDEIETIGEKLQRMYGLSEVEIETAMGVAKGGTPKTLARSSDAPTETVRSRLKSVFRKTRTSSQAELVSLIHNLPLWPPEPPPRLDAEDPKAAN